jgi:hypothetical protein
LSETGLHVQLCLSEPTTKTDSLGLDICVPSHSGAKTLADKPCFSLSREASRMTFPDTSNLLGTGSHTVGSTVHSKVFSLEVEEGVKENFLLSGFREEDLDDCTLAETLDTLVPLLREVGDPVPSSLFREILLLLHPYLLNCPANQGKVVGGLGPAMHGLEAWVLRPRPLR